MTNEILIKKIIFSYEQYDKFRFLIKKGVKGKINVIRDLPSCVIKKFNDNNVLKREIKDEQKNVCQPIDIVYVPIKKSHEIINCCFTDNLHLAYRSY